MEVGAWIVYKRSMEGSNEMTVIFPQKCVCSIVALVIVIAVFIAFEGMLMHIFKSDILACLPHVLVGASIGIAISALVVVIELRGQIKRLVLFDS